MQHTKSQFAPASLDEGTATKIGSMLQQRLGSLVDLALTLKHIHWNVVGPGFIGVHEMLDEHVAAVRDLSDELAERIATLGGIPNGLAGHLTESRTWDDYALGRGVVEAHLGALDLAYDGIIADHRRAIAEIGALDPVTEDILTAQTGVLELQQWFIRAHLANTSGELPTAEAADELDAASMAATADPLA
jgi:starvation-inducible DNA-binding protein